MSSKMLILVIVGLVVADALVLFYVGFKKNGWRKFWDKKPKPTPIITQKKSWWHSMRIRFQLVARAIKQRKRDQKTPVPATTVSGQKKSRWNLHPTVKIGRVQVFGAIILIALMLYYLFKFRHFIVLGLKYGGIALVVCLVIWALVWTIKKTPDVAWKWFSGNGMKILPITLALILINVLSWYVGWGWWNALWSFKENHHAFFWMFWLSILIISTLKIPGLAKLGVIAVIIGSAITVVGPSITTSRHRQSIYPTKDGVVVNCKAGEWSPKIAIKNTTTVDNLPLVVYERMLNERDVEIVPVEGRPYPNGTFFLRYRLPVDRNLMVRLE
jgi:hypothetical protein